MIIFISGGARSGKSHFAEQTALSIFRKVMGEIQKSSLYYIATAKKSDKEMKERIRIHQQDRLKHEWQTIEEPFHLLPILSKCKKDDVILIDCLTIWLSNVMFELKYPFEKIRNEVNSWLSIADKKQVHLLIVSNDVNEGIPFTDETVVKYMYFLQQLHQFIVQRSEIAVEVQAGVPTNWKGDVV